MRGRVMNKPFLISIAVGLALFMSTVADAEEQATKSTPKRITKDTTQDLRDIVKQVDTNSTKKEQLRGTQSLSGQRPTTTGTGPSTTEVNQGQ
jgi:hypothetical protein